VVKAVRHPKVAPEGTVRIAERHASNLTLFSLTCGLSLPPLLMLQAGVPAEFAVGVALLMVLCWFPMAWRTTRLALIAEPRRLVIENFTSTHTIPWAEVACFAVARAGERGEYRTVAAVLTDGTVIRARATMVNPKGLDHVLDQWRPVAEAHGIPWGDVPHRNRRSAKGVPPSGAPAGWYSDPDDQGDWRWWNGTQWGVRASEYGRAEPERSQGTG
jgi:hypothetical protein